MALIETVDLWKTYQMGEEQIHALRGVSIQIDRGEYVAIMGPSGSGKSTLMNLIGCLDTPSRGSYLLNNKQVSQMDDNELARIRNEEIDDLIILRPDGVPTYNFAVVVDDWDMQISHVIRGDDHVNNTPRQINILRALGADLPEYGHVPMILGPDGDKLSKRHGSVSVMQY